MFKKADKSKPVFCDTETHSLYGEICLFQYYQKGWEEAKVIAYPDPQELFQFVREHHTVWYNASYDLGTIAHQAGNKKFGVNLRLDDLLYASKTAFPEMERYSLDLVHDKLGMSFYNKELDKKQMQKSFTYAQAKKDRKATPDQIAYAKADVYTLAELWKNKKIKKVRKDNKAYALDIKSLIYSVNYQQNGIPVDQVALKKERAALVDKIAANEKFLDGLNPRSPKQVCEALGTSSSDKPTMVKLMAKGNELAKVIYKQRRLLKADKMLETWDYDRVHTFFNPAGAASSRFTSCFKGDTLIATNVGDKKIKSIKNGELVYTFNKDNQLTLKPVVRVHRNGYKPMIRVVYKDMANHTIHTLICTKDHRLRLFSGKKYIKAKNSLGKRISYFKRKERKNIGRIFINSSTKQPKDMTEEQLLKKNYFGQPSHMHAHHKDHNTMNNSVGNLEILSVGDHKKQHPTTGIQRFGDTNGYYRHDLTIFSCFRALIKTTGNLQEAEKLLNTSSTSIRNRIGNIADILKRRFDRDGKLISLNKIREAHHDSDTMLDLALRLNYLTDSQRSKQKYYKLYTLLEDYNLYNHQVIKIELIPQEKFMAYDLEVKDTHNYIANNLGVHNSGGDVGEGYINAQQISRPYQPMFKPEGIKKVVIDIDLSTAELRAAASIMNDSVMAEELRRGEDLHINTARDIMGIKNPTKEDRYRAKAVNFGLIFGMSSKTFKEYAYVSYGVSFTEAEALAIHRAYHWKYKGVSRYHRWVWNNFDSVSMETAWGHLNKPVRGTIALNFAVQGSIAETTKLAIHILVNRFPKALDYLVNTVHDCIILEVPKEEVELWGSRVNKAFLRSWQKICKSKVFKIKGIPMETEMEIR